MWVCICHGIRCRDVKDAADDGASRAVDVFRKFEVKVRCGKCVPTMRNLLCEDRGASSENENENQLPVLQTCCAEG